MKTDILYKKAVEARKNSYSPYSKYKVGSALRLSNGEVFSGCNIENASYGGTVCAERVAIWNALSQHAGQTIDEIVVVTDSDKAWPPCGFCRQVISEFAHADTKVHTANLKGIQHSFLFSELLPNSFNPSFLQKPAAK